MIIVDGVDFKKAEGKYIIAHDNAAIGEHPNIKVIHFNQVVHVKEVDENKHAFWGNVISGLHAGKRVESQYEHLQEGIAIYDEGELALAIANTPGEDERGN